MLAVGEINKLIVKEVRADGFILTSDEDETLFLSKLEKPEGAAEGDEIEVFLYRNAKKDIVPTTMVPYVMPGEFGFLIADEVSRVGALLDWGLSRQLFMPSREMKQRMQADRQYLVYVYYDVVSQQIIATGRINDYLNLSPARYKKNQEVQMLVVSEHERGYRVIVDNAHWGMIYTSEIFQYVKIGDKLKGYIKSVREDGKVDVSMQPLGIQVADELSEFILSELQKKGGKIYVSDHSDADTIANTFGCSKKSFKKTIGILFKARKIEIHDDYICLV